MKQQELKDLSVEDLNGKLNEAKAELQQKRFAHAVSPISNPMEIRQLRKDVARLKTELASRS